jgi:hypothetical protein
LLAIHGDSSEKSGQETDASVRYSSTGAQTEQSAMFGQ